MKILVLNNEFPPLGGGTGTVNRALLERFADVPGVELDLVTSALGRQARRERFAERIELFKVPVDNRNIHHSSNRELLHYAARALHTSLMLHRARQYDLCWAFSAVPAGGVALALRRLTGLRYTVRVCGPDIPGFEQRYAGLYPVLSPVIRAIWHGASAVVAKCEGEAQMIHAVDATMPVTLIPNGVDTTAFVPADRKAAGGPLRLVCVARLIERKGQHHLLEGVKRLVERGIDVRLDLIGTGDAEAANREQAKTLGLGERVQFLGYVPREAIAAHYAAADVFVLPSYNEGMSVATLEAMAAGLPVVVTRTGGTAELVGEGINGLVFAWSDVDTLTEHLSYLAANREVVERMGRASRARAELFSWERAAQHYQELFASIVTKGVASEDAHAPQSLAVR